MKSEREIFIEAMRNDQLFGVVASISGLTVEESLLPDGLGGFKYTNARIAWMSWQASANRDGYELVPVEPTQEMLDKFPEVLYQDTYAGEC